MSWLKRLLGTDQARAAAATAPRVMLPSHGRSIVSIEELDFVGQRSASPNRRYTLLWHDRQWFNGTATEGRYLLIDGDCVIAEGRMERPNDGKVADDGTFILNDWGASDALAGNFFAFRRDGSLNLSRSFSANLLNNGLSDDGRLAACQTANAPGSRDSSILTIFDLVAGDVIASWTAESGWASAYEFPEGRRIRMVRRDRPSLDYSLHGEFLDRRRWLEDEVRRGTLYVIRKALAEGEAGTGLTADDLRAGVNAALADEDDRFVADAWRLLGEVEESVDNFAAALDAYDRALAVNPKIGVANRAAALRRL